MPELLEVDVFIEKLDERINGRMLENIRVGLVRSFDRPLSDDTGRYVNGLGC
jgi:hypothetical protein